MLFPPSPALSACDSLDGINLDALLDSQGSLSHFPTPPLKKTPLVVTVDILDEDLDSDGDELPDYDHIATIFAKEASIDVDYTLEDIATVRRMITHAHLPPQLLALGLNILAGLHTHAPGSRNLLTTPPDLLTVAALSLAVTYTSDHPPQLSWWSRHVCGRTHSAKQIDKTILHILSALDFRLHEYSLPHNIQRTVSRLLSPEPEPGPAWSDARSRDPEAFTAEKQPLRLSIDGTSACWRNGQLTPDSTPPASAHPGLDSRISWTGFLPLL